MSTTQHVSLDKVGKILVISFPASPLSIHEQVLTEICEPILTAVQESSQVLLDLSSVDFFGSSFIELMFRVWNRVKNKPDGQFALCGLRPYCREVLDITNLTSVWPVFDNRDEALAAMKQAAATAQP